MPEFVNPFSGVLPGRKMTIQELIRGLRLSLSAEEEAVHLYTSLADASDNSLAEAVLRDIANEEKVHAGEFQRLLNILLTDEESFFAEGAAEVDALAEQMNEIKEPETVNTVPSIGDMKGLSTSKINRGRP
jgi:uncharacterized protein